MVSITRPSRGERWSATTTRQTGFFLPPTRVSLTRTANCQITSQKENFAAPDAPLQAPTLAATRQLLHRRHLALLELSHHLLHLAELLHELVHGLHVGAGSQRDPPPPRPVEDRRVAPLLGRHRRD